MSCNVYKQLSPMLFGAGAIDKSGDVAAGLHMKRVMVVTDPGINRLGYPERIMKSVREKNIEALLWAEAGNECRVEDLLLGAEKARNFKADGLIGIGGGSALDAAKSLGVLSTNDPDKILKNVEFYLENVKLHGGDPGYDHPVLPAILVPTTAGTGAEATFQSIIDNPATGNKIALPANPVYGIIDPELALGSPARLTAWCGFDAFSHAVECVLTRNTNKHNELLAFEAMRLIFKWLPVACEDINNYEAREELAWAANMAGIAFGETDCNIGHAVAQAMGHLFHFPHGLACASVTPGVIEFASRAHPGTVRRMGVAMGLDCVHVGDADIGKAVADHHRAMMRRVGIVSLTEFNGTAVKDALKPTADEVMKEPLATFYDGTFDRADVEALVTKAFSWK